MGIGTPTTPSPARPPRAVVWVLLLASAAAVLLAGLAGTALIFGRSGRSTDVVVPGPFWPRLLAACVLTLASLEVRSLRWVFLLRRAETRIPIRDAYIGYFAGLSLLLTPFLVGEIAVRAWILRVRGAVPVATTVLVNLWERLLDLVALAAIAGVLGWASAGPSPGIVMALGFAAALGLPPIRGACLRLAGGVAAATGRWAAGEASSPHTHRLRRSRTWLTALTASVVAWVLPGIGFWLLVGAWPRTFPMGSAVESYAASAGTAGLVLAPGGVLVAGTRLLDMLAENGFTPGVAALAVFATRVSTVGVATALGVVFLLVHRHSTPAASETHFNDIAAAYDVQIPEARRLALLTRKTKMMQEVLGHAPGARGLDVGCGQGTYVAEMRRLGFDVRGIDESAGQVAAALERLNDSSLVATGSALAIPAAAESCDFVYTINVLHHLPSLADQRRAFVELFRVLRPGGVLFVHEINTRNLLFRFYMGYVFPSLNCIDEGIERWLLPDRLSLYTDVPVADIRYFTFLPEFLPAALVRWLTPIERLAEASPLRAYSAHYMAVLRKQG